MTKWKSQEDSINSYQVIHPLDDIPEEKRAPLDSIGQISMTPMVRFSLMALRGYLLLMILLVLYRVMTLAGVLGHK